MTKHNQIQLFEDQKVRAVIVTYRRTRRLSMRIAQNGDVHVSAPVGMAKREVEAFIQNNRDWIDTARKNTAQRQQQRRDFYAQLPLDTPAQRHDATQRLQAIVAPLLQRHAAEMGVQPAAVTFRNTISRWGSCNHRTRRLSLSIYLLLLPEWCIEHVVVHELAHLLVPNHGPAFYAVMDRHFPRWREARAEARRLISSHQE